MYLESGEVAGSSYHYCSIHRHVYQFHFMGQNMRQIWQKKGELLGNQWEAKNVDTIGARGATRIIVLYTCTTKETRKKGCFFRLKRFLRIMIRGQNVPLFEERVLLDSIIKKGRLGVIFRTPPKISSPKACLGVNFLAKS